jgi:uncharacterized protein
MANESKVEINFRRLPRPDLVTAPIAEFIKSISEFPEVRFVLLFGSRAIGDAEDRSDADVSVSAPTISRQRWLEMRRLAEEARTLLRITLVHFDSSPPALQQRNLKEGIIVYESTQAT